MTDQMSLDLEQSRAIDELCDRFESALQRGEDPAIETWLQQGQSLGSPLLVELAAIDLDWKLRSGGHLRAAHYFDRFPVLAADPSLALRLVEVEYRAARAGGSLNQADFLQRYASLTELPGWQQGPWTMENDSSSPDTPVPVRSISPTSQAVTNDTAVQAWLHQLLAPPTQPGDLGMLGGYRVLGLLSKGGMGVVLRGEEVALSRPVAIKLMRPDLVHDSAIRKRFFREALAIAAVEHPRVVTIYRVEEHAGVPYLVMPLLQGESLAARLKRKTAVSLSDAVRWGREIAEGLAVAHARGLIHRDVKPDNIWLEPGEDGEHVRLLDFGLSREEKGELLTESGLLVGTPAYMSPEQAEGQPVDARADLFSLGCVLYELTTGQRPFTGSGLLTLLHALANQTPLAPHQVAPTVPVPLSQLIMQLIDKNPQGRPESAHQVAQALRAIEKGHSAPEQDTVLLPSPSSRRRSWIGPAVVTGLAVLLLLAWLLRRPTSSLPSGPEQPGPLVDSSSLRILGLDLRHIARIKGKEGIDHGEDRGLLGKRPVEVHLGDTLKITARLSRPGHAFLLACRPDGQVEMCYPQHEDEPPSLDEQPCYPPPGEAASYGLDEGTGLWVFVVVASSEPLPSFRQWQQRKRLKWSKGQGAGAAQGVAFWHNGEQGGLLPLLSGERGKGVVEPGEVEVAALARQLREPGHLVYCLGFVVQPRPGN